MVAPRVWPLTRLLRFPRPMTPPVGRICGDLVVAATCVADAAAAASQRRADAPARARLSGMPAGFGL